MTTDRIDKVDYARARKAAQRIIANAGSCRPSAELLRSEWEIIDASNLPNDSKEYLAQAARSTMRRNQTVLWVAVMVWAVVMCSVYAIKRGQL